MLEGRARRNRHADVEPGDSCVSLVTGCAEDARDLDLDRAIQL